MKLSHLLESADGDSVIISYPAVFTYVKGDDKEHEKIGQLDLVIGFDSKEDAENCKLTLEKTTIATRFFKELVEIEGTESPIFDFIMDSDFAEAFNVDEIKITHVNTDMMAVKVDWTPTTYRRTALKWFIALIFDDFENFAEYLGEYPKSMELVKKYFGDSVTMIETLTI